MESQKDQQADNYRSLKYLITGIDDMRDVISMIWGLINTKIPRDERVNMARMIIPGSVSLKQNSTSFILDLKVPPALMENKDAKRRKK
ncbi:MAG TPA: hypothetical protein ENO22_04490 [candidate division Zixibacteria bacterium]|nr:hypothetical protein [candidate division Zixibacteria bacterium]HEQ98584.1 hypothetical protein [candidate division Zixibacteria bacterium]